MKNKLSSLLAAGVLSLALTSTLHAGKPGAGDGKRGGEMKQKLLERFDANHNGTLDPEERTEVDKFRAERKKERLAKFDTNGDGTLDETERAAAKAAHPKRPGGKGKRGEPSPAPSAAPAS